MQDPNRPPKSAFANNTGRGYLDASHKPHPQKPAKKKGPLMMHLLSLSEK